MGKYWVQKEDRKDDMTAEIFNEAFAKIEPDVEKKIESIPIMGETENRSATLTKGDVLQFPYGSNILTDVKKVGNVVQVRLDVDATDLVQLNRPHPVTSGGVYSAIEEAKKGLREELAGGELEPIASVTVTPDTDGALPQSVVISQDTDGLPFMLSEFKIMCNVGSSGDNKSISVITNENDYMFSNVNIVLKDTKKQWFIHYLNLGQFGGIAYAPATAEAKYPNANISSMRLQAYPERTTHNKITLRVPTGYTFTEGTTFELWGVRA